MYKVIVCNANTSFNTSTCLFKVVIGGRNKYLINGVNANNTRVQDLFCSVGLNVNNPHFLIMQVSLVSAAVCCLCLKPYAQYFTQCAVSNILGEDHQSSEHEATWGIGYTCCPSSHHLYCFIQFSCLFASLLMTSSFRSDPCHDWGGSGNQDVRV